jgi:uroporphyrinogen-III synthase
MSGALVGFTVAVTADRRSDELATTLEHHGARVVVTPVLRIVPLADDGQLRAATMALLERPPDVVVANTAAGMRAWLEASEGWGLGDALRSSLAGAYLVARGPRTRTALRAAGLPDAWIPESESEADLLEHLIQAPHGAAKAARPLRGGRRQSASTPLHGQRIAVQLHGEPQEEFCGGLVAAGADVIEVPVYRFAPPVDSTPVQRLVDLITNGLVDAVTFTSAPAVGSLLRFAGPQTQPVVSALRGEVVAGCVGPVTAAPLRRLGVPVLAPARARLGALAEALVEELPRRTRLIEVAGARLVLRGHAAEVDGVLKPLPPAQMAILRALAASPGRVLPRSELLAALPRGADEHAVEMAVARLRAALGGSSLIQTVIKRGYRLGTGDST